MRGEPTNAASRLRAAILLSGALLGSRRTRPFAMGRPGILGWAARETVSVHRVLERAADGANLVVRESRRARLRPLSQPLSGPGSSRAIGVAGSPNAGNFTKACGVSTVDGVTIVIAVADQCRIAEPGYARRDGPRRLAAGKRVDPTGGAPCRDAFTPGALPRRRHCVRRGCTCPGGASPRRAGRRRTGRGRYRWRAPRRCRARQERRSPRRAHSCSA